MNDIDIDSRKASRAGDAGAALVEYGLLTALVALVCVAGVTVFGTQVATLFNVAF